VNPGRSNRRLKVRPTAQRTVSLTKLYTTMRHCLTLILTAILMIGAVAASADTHNQSVALTLNEFINLANQQSFEAMQYQQSQLPQEQQLKVADQLFLPKLNLTSKIGREQNDIYSTTYINNHTSGIDSTANVDWLLPTGANLSLSYQYQHGISHGLTSLGIPESKQHNITTTTRIEQPVIGGLWQNQQRLPQQRAKLQWRYYQAQGKQLRLNTQQAAYMAFLDYQEQIDLVGLLTQSLNYAQFRAAAVKARFEEGQTVKADLLYAQLDVHQRKTELKKAQDELNLIQQRVSASINSYLTVTLKPLASMQRLDQCSQLPYDKSTHASIAKHPELTMSTINTRIAYNDVQQNQFELWPQITLFYQNTDAHPFLTQDVSEQSWGIQATYTPFNTAAKLTKQQLRTEWVNANYTKEATRQELIKNLNLNRQSQRQLDQQLVLAKQGEQLAKQAFEHVQARFTHGVDSVLDVKAAQDEWLQQQRNTLFALKTLLANRMVLSISSGQLLDIGLCDDLH